jgi:RecB family endonuclease NucS
VAASAAVGLPSEAALHDLVEEAPHLLPPSGEPSFVVVGREVNLRSGYADLMAVESNGRLVIIEMRLRRNAEARRAVGRAGPDVRCLPQGRRSMALGA